MEVFIADLCPVESLLSFPNAFFPFLTPTLRGQSQCLANLQTKHISFPFRVVFRRQPSLVGQAGGHRAGAWLIPECSLVVTLFPNALQLPLLWRWREGSLAYSLGLLLLPQAHKQGVCTTQWQTPWHHACLLWAGSWCILWYTEGKSEFRCIGGYKAPPDKPLLGPFIWPIVFWQVTCGPFNVCVNREYSWLDWGYTYEDRKLLVVCIALTSILLHYLKSLTFSSRAVLRILMLNTLLHFPCFQI